jgi:hypothetical protein
MSIFSVFSTYENMVAKMTLGELREAQIEATTDLEGENDPTYRMLIEAELEAISLELKRRKNNG